MKTLIGAVDARVSILETQMNAGLSNLETKMDGQRDSLEAILKIRQTWLYILFWLIALTNAVALHIYQAIGLLK
ncbi:hypothetical protein ACQUQQ_08305 [Acidithiobacillus ferrooxidans]|uniref:hypothetical protein n=1 Tax=Acidithiobacillus ferrooxidans TaxID=920 RepID=UPI000A4988A2